MQIPQSQVSGCSRGKGLLLGERRVWWVSLLSSSDVSPSLRFCKLRATPKTEQSPSPPPLMLGLAP